MKSIRVLVVDDHAAIRKGVAELVDKADDMEVIGTANSGRAAIRMAVKLAPDVVVMDVIMPSVNGIVATRALHKTLPHLKIVALSLYSVLEYISGMLDAGASGYVLKESAYTELAEAIRIVHAGKLFIGKSLFKAMAHELLHLAANAADHDTKMFTDSEMEVLHHLAAGKQPAEISSMLLISMDEMEATCRAAIDKWLR